MYKFVFSAQPKAQITRAAKLKGNRVKIARSKYALRLMSELITQAPRFNAINAAIPVRVMIEYRVKSKTKDGQYNVDTPTLAAYNEIMRKVLVGIVYESENQVADFRSRKIYDNENAGITVWVEKLKINLEGKNAENN